ncbi:hypothetical protein [Aequitasia blattaphilus]|uniref:Uncharacterized protein n=1 Tax=Aequitasia blattaphilus TaxID=2949332 RepID=A0ABT1EGI2_9FIRM|nr:hypothetical protein [Aequitasia blattaphilus]MCP1103567.1 hypothetical protein [Aequitasia blattaphilus]MCR8616207.1 hypothetical protein [Aequitasia blattaphilus]
MSIEAYEKREQILELRGKVLQAEEERIKGERTLTISEARKELRKRAEEM